MQIAYRYPCFLGEGNEKEVLNKMRYFLVIIALVAVLCGSTLQRIEVGSMTNAILSLHTNSFNAPFEVGSLTIPNLPRLGPCPAGGTNDC